MAGVLTVWGRLGSSKPEKSSLLTSHPPAMFLLREEERDARDVNMCLLMEHTLNNVIVAVYVCGNIVTVCICTLALNRGRPLHSYNNEDVLV